MNGQLAGEVEVGLKLHAARDFVGDAHVLLLESIRCCWYIAPVTGGRLCPRWTRQKSVFVGYVVPVARKHLSSLDSAAIHLAA